MATLSTKKITVKPKPNNKKPKILSRGIIKYIVLVLAVFGANRGVSFHRSLVQKLFTLYALGWLLISCSVSIQVTFFTPILGTVTSYIRATSYSIYHYTTAIYIMANSYKLHSIYTRIDKVDYDLYVDSSKKLTPWITCIFLTIVIGHELHDLGTYIIYTFEGKPKAYIFYSLWYTFFMLHMELLWRIFVLKYVRIQLQFVYQHLKKLQKSAEFRNNSLKLSLQKSTYKNRSDEEVDADLVKIEKIYENILEIQHSMISLLNPLFIINVLCSMSRALCDVYQTIKEVRSNPTVSVILEEVIYLPLKLKTVILTLAICREFQLMAILDKKINIKLVEMLVDRNDKKSRKEILKFIHCIEINEKKFLLRRIIPLDMSLPWLCIVIILQFSVLVLQFLKAFS